MDQIDQQVASTGVERKVRSLLVGGHSQLIVEAQARGTPFLAKPFGLAELRRMVRTLIERTPLASGSPVQRPDLPEGDYAAKRKPLLSRDRQGNLRRAARRHYLPPPPLPVAVTGTSPVVSAPAWIQMSNAIASEPAVAAAVYLGWPAWRNQTWIRSVKDGRLGTGRPGLYPVPA